MHEDVFPGMSAMARRMREVDWSQTVLGPVELWPQSLRTSVGICLDCAFPILIWWGPQLALLYNDEYRTLLGRKDAHALGQPGAEVWSEIWDVIGPMLGQVMAHGAATRSRDLLLHVVREGYAEEAYFSFSYSPIQGEDGNVAGIFCPVIETTDKVIGERRLRTLRDLAAQCKGTGSEAAAYAAAAAVLADNRHDVPLALIYRIDSAQSVAELAATAGIEPGAAAAPLRVSLAGDDGGSGVWALQGVASSGRSATLGELSARHGALPAGAWRTPPESAMVLPILLPGHERPRAILVAAVSPMRRLDDDYRTFFALVATQVAACVADAQALAAERERAAALAEIDRAKTVFFSNVSHEFRTPLTLMLGPLQAALAGEHGTLPGGVLQSLELAHRNGLRMQKLVNTLLDFSRIEAGRIEATFEPTDLAALTRELASLFRSAIESGGLRLVVDCPEQPKPIHVDREMWEKVVLNLLSNAFKFTFDGEIRIALHGHGDRVDLVVSDTGVGIPQGDLPRMFERFHRVRNARARTEEGTGIGLALVRELVRLHGGEVVVESVEGRGSTFTVTIPTGTAHLPADHVGAEPRPVATRLGANVYVGELLRWVPASGGPVRRSDGGAVIDRGGARLAAPVHGAPRARILLADDNADMRDYLQGLLGGLYEVETVADGQAALERVRENPPDLLLSDVMMPRLDGLGLLGAIRGDERLRTLPVILLSARAGEEASIEGLQAGADGYLPKPFGARDLVARVATLLELARVRRQADEELREADRRKDAFLATLAHELRNPLAPLGNGLEVLRLLSDRDPAIAPTRMMMERQLRQLTRLVDDLLDLSRITRDHVELRRERVDLASVVASALETSRPLVDGAGHRLLVSLPSAPVHLRADPIRLAQVLSNLLNNAAKYTDPGGEIGLAVETHGTQVVVRVRDTGVGIPIGMADRIFEMFTQVDPSLARGQGGLGVGLTLVKRLVEMHGGTVEAHSGGPGLGSEFVVCLPLEPEDAAPVALTEETAGCPGAPARRRILVVDDNRDSAESLAAFLELEGNDVRIAYDGAEALETAREHPPQVVLLDIGLPGLSGYEVARRMRAEPALRDVVLIAQTGWGQEEDRSRARQAGFDHHLVKPIRFEALAGLLEKPHDITAGRG